MANRCKTCDQTPTDNRHPKAMIPLKGEIREAWGLGIVWKTCCGTVHGMYYDKGANSHITMYLGKDEEEALEGVKFVKNRALSHQDGAHVPYVKK